jgi:glycosidase
MTWDKGGWDTDTLRWVKTLARMRRDNIALRRGSESTLFASENVIVRHRLHSQQGVVVAANRSATEQRVKLSLPRWAAEGRDLLSGGPTSFAELVIPPKGVRVVEHTI